jgi:CRP/FNR family transcriptional regulator
MQNIVVSYEEKINAIRKCSYFVDLDDTVLGQLTPGTALYRYERGEVLFWEGDPCHGLHIIRSGSVKLFKISPQGREFIINIFEAGGTYNEVPVFDSGTNPVNVAALDTCYVWVIDPAVIHAALDRHPEMCHAVIANLSKNLRMLVNKVEELSFYQVTNRLARLISQLPEEQLSGGNPYRITQDQLAARLGTVREVVARSLRELQRSGAIKVRQRQIEILDEKVLRSWAQSPYD